MPTSGKYAMLHDIVAWESEYDGGYGFAVVVGVKVGQYGDRFTECRFWLPTSKVLGSKRIPVSDEDMERCELIGPLPEWAEWDG